MKNLTRIQAWKKIQRAFRNYHQYADTDDFASLGLCYSVRRLWTQGHITNRMREQMKEDIYRAKPFSDSCGFYWPEGIEGAKQRVKAITKILASRTKPKR